MAPSKCQALVIRQPEGTPKLEKESIPVPTPGPHQVLVRVQYVAQNPTDVQSFDGKLFGEGSVLGCDFVGQVEELGPNVTNYKKGDTIAGLIWGGETPGLGGYSEYTIAEEHISFKLPEGVAPEVAATVPLASLTSWLALFSRDSLNIDRGRGSDINLLIWGGSSSVGLYAIQIASSYGFNIVTTCSPQHFDLVKSYGAHHAFDYRDPDIAHKITQAQPGIRYVFDTICKDKSSVTAAETVADEGGILCTVRPGKALTEGVTKRVKVTDVLVWTAWWKDHSFREFTWPASKEDHDLSRYFCRKLPGLLESGKLKPSTAKVYKNGLEDVPQGFQDHRVGKISAYKIVYEL